MTASVLPLQVFEAPETWRTVDFISDLHLQDKETATFDVWQAYMQNTTADAVFILGDLFEVWVGDDAVEHHSFLQRCATVLKACATKRQVAFMRGNRDFLVGTAFLNACNVIDLQDPTVLNFASQKWLLVRKPSWQNDFLAKPLTQREHIARQLRTQSEILKKDSRAVYADVADEWSSQLLQQAGATCLVHGHTHRPALHSLGQDPPKQRYVLSDWDVASARPRAEVMRWHFEGQVERINLIS
ncbi:MAG: UDP-2,3-diacylglucosamine hydrolase [Pseudomonadota bacterium]